MFRQIFNYTEDNTFLTAKEKEILFDIGLPIIDTDYYTFHPIKELQTFIIENKSFVILGSPSGFSFKDNIIVLCLETKKIYFYCKPLYDIGYYKAMFSNANESLENFICFQYLILDFCNKTISANIDAFENINRAFFSLKNRLINIDSFGFNSEILHWDKISYWDKVFFDLQQDIEEKFDSFLEVNKM